MKTEIKTEVNVEVLKKTMRLLDSDKVKELKIFEEEGVRYIETEVYVREAQFQLHDSARTECRSSLTRLFKMMAAQQVEKYECHYKRQENTFVEASSYTAQNTYYQARLEIMKDKLQEVLAIAEDLSLDDIRVDGMGIYTESRREQATFKTAIDSLMNLFSCEN